MEKLFEHRSSTPWSWRSDSVAVGPKVPSSASRGPRWPPSTKELPQAPEMVLAPPEIQAKEIFVPGREALRPERS